MAVPRLLDTSEALPSLSTHHHPIPTTAATKPNSKRPLQTDSELSRSQKHTERLRRKRHKRLQLHQKRRDLAALATTSHKHAVRLDKETALKALEHAKNVVIDPSARKRIAPAVLFKKGKRESLLRKDCGFSKRGRKQEKKK